MRTTIQLAAIVIAMIVIVYSCNSDNTVTPPPAGNCTITSLSGQLVNYSHTGKVYLYLAVYDSTRANRYVVDTGTISSGGSFSINLSTPPTGGLVTPTTDTSCHPTTTYPAGTKLAVAFFEVYDSTNTRIGAILRSNYDTNGFAAGEFVASYVYSNMAYSLSGTSICTLRQDTVNVSVSGQACWNLIVNLYVHVYGGRVTTLSESNTEPDNSAKWYYIGAPLSDKPYQNINGTGSEKTKSY